VHTQSPGKASGWSATVPRLACLPATYALLLLLLLLLRPSRNKDGRAVLCSANAGPADDARLLCCLSLVVCSRSVGGVSLLPLLSTLLLLLLGTLLLLLLCPASVLSEYQLAS
jgi:hypothetical protein